MTPRPFATLRAVVAEVYGIPETKLVGRNVGRKYSRPRQVLACLCRELFGMSYAEVGALIDRDHTTVIYARRCVMKQLGDSDITRFRVSRITQEYARRMIMGEAA